MPPIYSRCAPGTVEVMGAVMQAHLAVSAIRVGEEQTAPCLSALRTAHNMEMDIVIRCFLFVCLFLQICAVSSDIYFQFPVLIFKLQQIKMEYCYRCAIERSS